MEQMNRPHVGDYVCSSWGYEQTNIDFYRVTKVTDHFVWLQEWTQKLVSVESWGSETVVPGDQPKQKGYWETVDGESVHVTREAKVLRRKWRAYGDDQYSVCVTDYDYGKRWSYQPVLQTHWH